MQITLKHLNHQFKAVTALKDLQCTIDSGKITGLVGPDGAGKTTLLRLIAGLLKPTQGAITIEGLDPIDDLETLRPHMGYMPQKFGLYEDLTVMENLTLYADLHNVVGVTRQARFDKLLAFTDLANFTQRPAGKLSGGMKQKLGLACVLISAPKLLLLDEPSVGVDPISRQELWRMVKALANDGMTIIWSTAYLDEAERCDTVLLMNMGTILYQGTPKSLEQRMANRCFLIQNSTHKRRLLQWLLNQAETVDCVIQGQSVRLVVKNAHQFPPMPEDAALTSIPTSPRLEDAFIDLLGGAPKGHSLLAERIKTQAAINSPAVMIEARHLSKMFGTFCATDTVNFSVHRGEIFGLLGPNGAGKSTTFKMMCGLLKPTHGKAFVMGIDLKKSPALARQKLGYMAQKFALYGQLSVLQNLNFFAGIYGLLGKKRISKVAQMIELFALKPYIHSDTEALPLGYKQRLALACAMMHEPQILFLDEPTSGVDPLTRREFWTHINGLVDAGITVMVTTHFMDEAEYCDRIGLVYRGKLIVCATPDQLKQRVATDAEPNPSMETAFIKLIQNHDHDHD